MENLTNFGNLLLRCLNPSNITRKLSHIGCEFSPSDEELIEHYLKLKNEGKHEEVSNITTVDLAKVDPSDLPAKSAIKTRNACEWFFFCRLGRRGRYLKRSTPEGIWKSAGSKRKIKSGINKSEIGMKRMFVFHTGKGRNATKTSWIMTEYRPSPPPNDLVLIRLVKKEKVGDLSDNRKFDSRIFDDLGDLEQPPPFRPSTLLLEEQLLMGPHMQKSSDEDEDGAFKAFIGDKAASLLSCLSFVGDKAASLLSCLSMNEHGREGTSNVEENVSSPATTLHFHGLNKVDNSRSKSARFSRSKSAWFSRSKSVRF